MKCPLFCQTWKSQRVVACLKEYLLMKYIVRSSRRYFCARHFITHVSTTCNLINYVKDTFGRWSDERQAQVNKVMHFVDNFRLVISLSLLEMVWDNLDQTHSLDRFISGVMNQNLNKSFSFFFFFVIFGDPQPSFHTSPGYFNFHNRCC